MPVFNYFSKFEQRHLGVVSLAFYLLHKFIHKFLDLELLGDADLKLLKHVDDALLDHFVVFHVRFVAEVELINVDFAYIVSIDV